MSATGRIVVLPVTEEALIRKLLAAQTWAVVGLRDNPARPAYGVARFLQSQGKRIVPVHQHPQDVFGERAYARLADIPFPVDVVDVFVNSAKAGAVADQAVEIGARAVWFQLDVTDPAAYERVTSAGLDMVMDRCPAIEWPHHGPAVDSSR
jgi:predicted CoA-binding protein